MGARSLNIPKNKILNEMKPTNHMLPQQNKRRLVRDADDNDNLIFQTEPYKPIMNSVNKEGLIDVFYDKD